MAQMLDAEMVSAHREGSMTSVYTLPYAATKTDVRSAMTVLFVTPNWPAICSLAGAIMEDETGLMKVNAETIRVAAHFFFFDQL